MGGQESKFVKSEFVRELGHNYMLLKELSDSRFGDIVIYKNKNEDKWVARRTQICNSDHDYH